MDHLFGKHARNGDEAGRKADHFNFGLRNEGETLRWARNKITAIP